MLLSDDPAAQELHLLLEKAIDAADSGLTSIQFADSIGLERGVTGYTYHTVPVAVHASLRYRNSFEDAIVQVVQCGGDTDTVAAIVGGDFRSSGWSERAP